MRHMGKVGESVSSKPIEGASTQRLNDIDMNHIPDGGLKIPSGLIHSAFMDALETLTGTRRDRSMFKSWLTGFFRRWILNVDW
jgi:hypothetical protein